MLKNASKLIQDEYLIAENDWYLGYSGGKDSTALLVLVLNAIRYKKNDKCRLHIIYCDTGVEFPLITSMVYRLFNDLSKEITAERSDITFEIVKPEVCDRFFSMVIGKGYVPPTFLFRWCTKRLRIKPIQKSLFLNSSKATILLGIREGESGTRDKVIDTHRVSEYFTKQSNSQSSIVFCPIIHFSVVDVWNQICVEYPYSVDRDQIKRLYSCIGTKFINGNYSGDMTTGRYGCWVCTVIRKDKAMQGLIDNGYSDLIPLRDFIEWLKSIRDDKQRRTPNRLTNVEGQGPFNLQTRREILEHLIFAQTESNYTLITEEELTYILDYWVIEEKN